MTTSDMPVGCQAMIIFILTASTAIIFTWEHVLWVRLPVSLQVRFAVADFDFARQVKVAFPVGSLLLEIIGVCMPPFMAILLPFSVSVQSLTAAPLTFTEAASWIYGTVSCGEYFNENAPVSHLPTRLLDAAQYWRSV